MVPCVARQHTFCVSGGGAGKCGLNLASLSWDNEKIMQMLRSIGPMSFYPKKLLYSCLGAVCVIGSNANAQTNLDGARYGSFVRFDEVPEILFLVGPIKDGDFFELRRAMRDQPVQLVVTNSPGGNVYEALQVATIIHDNSIATFVPSTARCTSACAYVFFAGTSREVEGELGVHQFYAGNEVGGESISLNDGLRSAQYTTSEIIGFLNEFGTPPFVFEKMFSTEDMYFFIEAERELISSGQWDPSLLALKEKSAVVLSEKLPDFPTDSRQPTEDLTDNPSTTIPPSEDSTFERLVSTDIAGADILPRGIKGVSINECEWFCSSSTVCVGYSYVPQTSWCWPKDRAFPLVSKPGIVSGVKQREPGLSSMEEAAITLLVGVNLVWSKPNEFAISALQEFYSESVDFYGNDMTRDSVMREKRAFAERWPIRKYEVVPESVDLACDANGCYVESVIEWTAASTERGARSSGRSSWNLILEHQVEGLKIISESGKVLDRE